MLRKQGTPGRDFIRAAGRTVSVAFYDIIIIIVLYVNNDDKCENIFPAGVPIPSTVYKADRGNASPLFAALHRYDLRRSPEVGGMNDRNGQADDGQACLDPVIVSPLVK